MREKKKLLMHFLHNFTLVNKNLNIYFQMFLIKIKNKNRNFAQFFKYFSLKYFSLKYYFFTLKQSFKRINST